MDFDKILAELKKIDVEVKQGGFYKTGTKRKADEAADSILRLNGVDRKEFVDEYDRRLKQKLAELAEKANENIPGSLTQDYVWVTFQHEALADVDSLGDPDKKLFNKIKYALNPFDGSVILLVNMHDANWKAVPLSGGSADRIQLVTLCSQAVPNHPELFKNYYEEIEAYTTKPIRKTFKDYRDKKIKDKTLLAYELLEKVPHTLLRNSCVKVLCKKTKVTLSEDKEELLFVPKTAGLYVSPESTERYDPFAHLVKKAHALAALPFFQCSMPAIISNKLDEPALHYFDLKAIRKEGPTPTWDEFGERFSEDDFKTLKAFIWSIFKAKNKGRQLLYIYDPDGFSGKSVLMSVLARYLGPDISASIQKDSLNNQFSLAKIWDKRLVTIDDNKNRNLIRSEKMHMILGGGWADIEMKGRNSFHAKLFTKMIAGGNIPLSIDPYAVHERSRLIMIKTQMNDEILKRFCQTDAEGNLVKRNGKPVPLGDPDFEENLFDEFEAFLTKCREAYRELCPSDANIILTEAQNEALFSLADDNDYIYDQILDTGYEVGEEYSMSPFDFQTVFYNTRTSIALSMGIKGGLDTVTLADFKEYLAKRYSFYGVRRMRSQGARWRFVYGLHKKEDCFRLPGSSIVRRGV